MSSSLDPAEQDERDAPVEAATLETPVQDALPVLAAEARAAEARVTRVLPAANARAELARSAGSVMPAVQAAAVAAGGFVAGAAVVGLVHRRQQRAGTLAKGRRAANAVARSSSGRGAGRAAELVQIVGSRSLLVDVHLLGSSGDH
jgi:hypothetical protein